jgi:hypothetical protein
MWNTEWCEVGEFMPNRALRHRFREYQYPLPARQTGRQHHLHGTKFWYETFCAIDDVDTTERRIAKKLPRDCSSQTKEKKRKASSFIVVQQFRAIKRHAPTTVVAETKAAHGHSFIHDLARRTFWVHRFRVIRGG